MPGIRAFSCCEINESDSDFQAGASWLLDSANAIFKNVLILLSQGEKEENSSGRGIAPWIAVFPKSLVGSVLSWGPAPQMREEGGRSCSQCMAQPPSPRPISAARAAESKPSSTAEGEGW